MTYRSNDVPSLAEFQGSLAAALTATQPAVPPEILDRGIGAARRLGIYRNAIRARLTEALAAVYPAVQRLVGQECFNYLASQLIADAPPRSASLHSFGGELPAFCGRLPLLAGLVYLPDVARLEWAWHSAYHAADATPISVQALATVPQEGWADLRLDLHPSARLLRSPYPVLRIFEINQAGYEGDDRVRLDAGGDSLLILRPSLEVQIIRLDPGEYELLAALWNGADLAGALAAADAFDPPAALARLFATGVFAGVAGNLTRCS